MSEMTKPKGYCELCFEPFGEGDLQATYTDWKVLGWVHQLCPDDDDDVLAVVTTETGEE